MPNQRSAVYALVLALVLVGGVGQPLRAQDEEPVVMEGVIADDSARVMANALVTFERIVPADLLRQVTLTDSAGRFTVALPPGVYRYEAAIPGVRSDTGEIRVRRRGAEEMVMITSAVPIPGFPTSRHFNLFDVNYFSFGATGREPSRPAFQNANQVKFRVSLRYKIANLSRCDSCRTGVYAAYTQTSFWHLYDDDAPFFDNNYSPGVLVYKAIDEGARPNYAGVMVFAGVFHESNGRDGPFSRGWNRVVGGASVGTVHHTPVSATLSLWIPWGEEPNNRDLADYTGYGELMVYLQPGAAGGDGGPLSLQLRSRLGRKVVQSVEANVMYDVQGRAGQYFTPSVFVQLFSGYAENLLTYNQRRTVVRAGLAVLR